MADRVPYDRTVLVEVLVYHWPTATSGCFCGWNVLGASHSEHVADVYEASMAARRAGTVCSTCDGTGVQKDDRNCNCLVPALDGAGQHAGGCACLKPCPCGATTPEGSSDG